MSRLMRPKARGRIVSWEGASLWILEVERGGSDFPRTDFHAHHAVQVTIALRGHFDFYGRGHDLRAATSAAVAPDTEHAYEQKQGMVAHLFIAPESRAGRAIARALFADGSLQRLPTRKLGTLPQQLAAARSDVKLIELGRALVARLAAEQVAAEPDGRVERVIAWATDQLDEPLTLTEASEQVGLSPGRLRHLFVEQTGLPFKVFLLWLRLTKAVQLFSSGASLTESAHAAGFSDSAHFSRTFRRMFGIMATSLTVHPERSRGT